MKMVFFLTGDNFFVRSGIPQFKNKRRQGGIFSCRSATYGRARQEKCRIGGF
ncbi:hypothetical protein IJG29_03565 [Candidatus Saccharibacteria bacterium]|nr:hypothetical protein [Candidatus Saccharibacteria bacterium]